MGVAPNSQGRYHRVTISVSLLVMRQIEAASERAGLRPSAWVREIVEDTIALDSEDAA
jgi:hypothetical protein